MLKRIIFLFLAWRLFLFIPLILSEIFLKARVGFDYTSPSYFSPISHFLLAPWANFDGIYYLIIAAGGYTVDNSVFFPLFPILINIFSLGNPAFSSGQFSVAIVIPSVLFLGSLIVFNKLLRIDYKENIAFLSIIFFLLFPTSFFFAAVYSESLFLLLTLGSFYFARKKKWFLASILVGFLTATRVVGIAMIPALIYEFMKNEKNLFQKKAIPLILSPLGFMSYVYFNYKEWGNAFQFIDAQKNVGYERTVGQIILLPQTIYRYFNILFNVPSSTYEWWIALLELSLFIFASFMIYFAWKKKVRFSYVLFSILAFLIPASTGTFTSFPRYILILFPIFIVLALIKSSLVKYIYSTVGIILLILLLALFSKGFFVS